MMEDQMGGCLFVGSRDKLICNLGGINPRLLSGRKPSVPETLRRVANYPVGGIQDGPHEQDWIRACKESPGNRVQPFSNFDNAGTEEVFIVEQSPPMTCPELAVKPAYRLNREVRQFSSL